MSTESAEKSLADSIEDLQDKYMHKYYEAMFYECVIDSLREYLTPSEIITLERIMKHKDRIVSEYINEMWMKIQGAATTEKKG